MDPEQRVSSARAENEAERKAIADVRDGGLHILHIVDPDGEEPCFSYTLGLWHTFRHPEILIFGLKSELCQVLLNNCRAAIAEGSSFRQGESSTDVPDGFRCYFEPLNRKDFAPRLGWARWFYDGDGFEAVQMLWPDTSGIYPWQSTASDYLRWDQPVLTSVPKLVV